MFKLARIVLLSGSVMVSACGGGSSSGGGGGGPTQFAGTYNGTETLTITFLGESKTGSAPITITIGNDGTVTVVDEAGIAHRGSLNNASFTANGSEEGLTDPELPGVTCDAAQTYTGTVDGDTITGTTSGNLSCTQGGSDFTATFSGDFSATRSN
jgi:hypothetical protein